MTANESIMKQLEILENAMYEIKKTLGVADVVPAAASRGAKRAKKEKNPDAPKRAPSDYIVFSSKTVGPLIRESEAALDKSEKTKVGTITQFAGHLWGQKHEGWTPESIMAEWENFTPPSVSKQTLEGKSKSSRSSTGSAEKSEPEADAPDAGKKTRKPQSEETKKAAAAKRAATLAAMKAATASEPAPAEEAAPAAPAPPKAKLQLKPKAKAAEPKTVDLKLDPWTHDGTDYLKNERNDVVSIDGEWVGRWNGTEIDESVPEPADFETLTSRD